MNFSARRQAFIGGVSIFVAALIGALMIGRIYSDTHARILIEAMAPSLHTLCFAIITASATVLSLLLTTVSFTQQLDKSFDTRFYRQLRLIAQMCSLVLVLAVIVLLALTIPLTESDSLGPLFTATYYLLIIASAVLAALIVATVLLLYRTIGDIISVVYPEDEPHQP